MRTAVYLRQSKDQNGSGLAIARQREDCESLCARRGWQVAETYIDNDVSASTGRVRPAYARMLADVEAGKLDAVVVWAYDRLARRPIEFEQFIDLADRHRLALATVSGDHDLSTDEGRLYVRIMGAVARDEMAKKSKRQRREARQRAERGEPHVSGPRAFGYQPDGMTIREDEAEALRGAYAAILAGATLVSLCRDLTAAGFTTPAGKPFRHSGIRAMLLNHRNIAIRTYSTRGADKKLTTEVVGAAKWPAIIDRETFDAVRSILEDSGRRQNHNTGTARRWLLGGLAVCGHPERDGEICGAPMRVNYREKDRHGEQVRIYKCRAHNHLSRAADWVDWRVTEHVIERLSRPYARDLLVDDQQENLAELRREADLLATRLSQLGEDFAEGLVARATMVSGSERLRTKLADLAGRMEHIDRAPILADLVNADDVRTKWDTIGLDRQRAVINLLYKVILLPRPPGRYETPIESVIMEPKIS
jgi:site-specific DNA recombinase